MATSILTLLGAIVTILGPLLVAGVAAYLDRKHEESIHASVDETDEYIKQVLARNPVGLLELSRQLERLHRAAKRKRSL